jgi:hypothetical protein
MDGEKRAKSKFRGNKDGENRLETVPETDSYESSINLSKENELLEELTSREQNFYKFKKIGNPEYFQYAINHLQGTENEALIKALYIEINGYSKPNMTDEERAEEHNKFQKLLSLEFMMDSEDDDEEEGSSFNKDELYKELKQELEEKNKDPDAPPPPKEELICDNVEMIKYMAKSGQNNED